jgi:hypothetical protein
MEWGHPTQTFSGAAQWFIVFPEYPNSIQRVNTFDMLLRFYVRLPPFFRLHYTRASLKGVHLLTEIDLIRAFKELHQ